MSKLVFLQEREEDVELEHVKEIFIGVAEGGYIALRINDKTYQFLAIEDALSLAEGLKRQVRRVRQARKRAH